jgi:hypothetical protein
MNKRILHCLRIAAVCLVPILMATGCATVVVPEGCTGTVGLMTGGFVETMQFANGRTFNIQVTEDELPEGEVGYPHVLTIGRYSTLMGSGFAVRSNIYYEARIGPYGSDTFSVADEEYRVQWHSSNYRTVLDPERTIFEVSIGREQP